MIITACTSAVVISQPITSYERQGNSIGIIGGSTDISAVYDTRAAERSGLHHTHNQARSTAAGTGFLRIVHRTGHIERQRGSLTKIQVQISTIVETLVAVVIMEIVELGKQTALCHETCRDEVTHRLGTSADVNIMLGLHGHILHDVIHPTHTRETDGVAAVLELLKHFVGEHRIEGFAAAEIEVVPLHLVEESTIFITVCLFQKFGRGQCRE